MAVATLATYSLLAGSEVMREIVYARIEHTAIASNAITMKYADGRFTCVLMVTFPPTG